jgi:mono/diheme cytochrome c family protein
VPGAPRQTKTNATDPRTRQLYEDKCADCHGKNGQGQTGAYPALAGNRAVLMNPPNNAVLSVLHGGFAPATAGNPRPYGMPPFVLELSNADIAAVMTYVRGAWGNAGAPVSALQVQQIRRTQAAP